MKFTKTLTFERVLIESLTLQERLDEHFPDLPLLSTQTKVLLYLLINYG